LAWHDGGRIIVGWKSEEVQVDILVCRSQLIHLKASPLNGFPFLCTFVYGSNDKRERQQLFSDLGAISQQVSSPWIILGDFNCVANLDERIGSPVRLAEIQPLQDCLAVCRVHDLKYYGHFLRGPISKQEPIGC
jgi:hypothetical protein